MLFWILEITKTVMDYKISHGKIMIGAAVGSILFCVILLIFPIPIWIKLMIGCGIVSLLLIRYLFFCQWHIGFGKVTSIVVGVTVILGGILDILWKYLPALQLNTLVLIFIASMIGVILKWIGMKIIKKRQPYNCEVKIDIGGKANIFLGLIDTGNGLVDPISKKPVSVISQSMEERISEICRPEKLKMIPFATVGENGLLVGYEIEEMTLVSDGVEQVIKNPILAIAQNEALGKQRYDVIVHPQVLE